MDMGFLRRFWLGNLSLRALGPPGRLRLDLVCGPDWLSCRTGGEYVGWAPVPPRGPGVVYEGHPIGARVDIDFDIGPEYYNFIDARFIGEPVLRDRIFAPSQNVTYINN